MTHAVTGKEPSTDDAEPPCPLHVFVANETKAPIDGERIEAAVRVALSEALFQSAEVSVAVVTDAAIHQLNRQFLEHDYPTDVLSFVLEDDGAHLEGEIVVSAETAERCAAEAGWSAADELLLYVVHGALHLAGYGDKQPSEAAAMLAAEAAVLDELGVMRSASDSRWHAASPADDAPEAPIS